MLTCFASWRKLQKFRFHFRWRTSIKPNLLLRSVLLNFDTRFLDIRTSTNVLESGENVSICCYEGCLKLSVLWWVATSCASLRCAWVARRRRRRTILRPPHCILSHSRLRPYRGEGTLGYAGKWIRRGYCCIFLMSRFYQRSCLIMKAVKDFFQRICLVITLFLSVFGNCDQFQCRLLIDM